MTTDAPENRRYIEIDGRRWRRSDPDIPVRLRTELVAELMAARSAVGTARHRGNDALLREARGRVQDAKVALGERGRAWWLAPRDADRQMRVRAAIRTLLRQRGPDSSICPSDAARVVGGPAWRKTMDLTRAVAGELADAGWLRITRRGEPVAATSRGPLRLRLVAALAESATR